MKILIADNSPHLRRALRHVIEAHEGWTVCSEAQDGPDAVEQAKHCKPDLVLLDLALPHISGLAAASRISKLLPDVPILMHTLYDSPPLQTAARRSGVWQVIPKSESHALIATIEALAQTIGPSEPTPADKEKATRSQGSTPKESAA